MSGVTGGVHARRAFMALCFYQVLRHFVRDKVSARARGPRAPLTRQPVAGRANQGGLRLGGMEIDALIAHAASNVLLERQHASDEYDLPVCARCGAPAEEREVTLASLLAAVEEAEAAARDAQGGAGGAGSKRKREEDDGAASAVLDAPVTALAPTAWCRHCSTGEHVVRLPTTYVSAQLLRAELLTAGMDARYVIQNS
jgi:hypothetical protein